MILNFHLHLSTFIFRVFPALIAHASCHLCFPPPAFRVLLRPAVKKSCMFSEKNRKKILSVRGIVVPLHSLSEKFPGASLKEAIFDILQTATRQRLPVPVPPGNSGDCSSKKIRRFIYNRIQWIPIERICPGQNTDNFFQVSVTPHLII